MPRNYVRKTWKDTDHEEKLRIAVGEVLAGRCTIRKAAEKTGLPKSTVGFYTKRHHACGLLPPLKVKRLQHSTQILPASFESELADYLKDCPSSIMAFFFFSSTIHNVRFDVHPVETSRCSGSLSVFFSRALSN